MEGGRKGAKEGVHHWLLKVVVPYWSECRQLRSDALGSIPSSYTPIIFSLSLFLC